MVFVSADLGSWFGRLKTPLFVPKRGHTLLTLQGRVSEFMYFPFCHTDVKPLLYSPKVCLSCVTAYLLSITKGLPMQAAEVSHYFMDTLKMFTEILCALRKVTPSSFYVVLCPQTVFLLRLNLHPSLLQSGFLLT